MLHRVHPALIADLAVLQGRILRRAADWVKPGGTLVFATCSLEPAEGEAQVEAFLRDRPDFALREGGEQGRVLPGRFAGGNDGFFIAALVRE